MSINEQQSLLEDVLKKCSQSDSSQTIRKYIYDVVSNHYQDAYMSVADKQKIASRIYNSMCGMDILQPLLDDPEITEIMVNSPDQIYIEKKGKITRCDLCFDDLNHLMRVISHCFGQANKQLHEQNPFADMRLKTGERVHAVIPPVALSGPSLCIRKFTGVHPGLEALIASDFISEDAAAFLRSAVKHKKNIFICGGTGSGKTTLLNALSSCIPQDERVITVEDSAEIVMLNIANRVQLETKDAAPDGTGAVTLTDLIRTAMRMRPDRLIVGEVRGSEAFDMLQAMNTGHPGSLSTGHANSCEDLLDRLSLMVLMAVEIPWDAIRSLLISALDLIIYISRSDSGKRHIMSICEITGFDRGQYMLRTLYERGQKGDLLNVSQE